MWGGGGLQLSMGGVYAWELVKGWQKDQNWKSYNARALPFSNFQNIKKVLEGRGGGGNFGNFAPLLPFSHNRVNKEIHSVLFPLRGAELLKKKMKRGRRTGAHSIFWGGGIVRKRGNFFGGKGWDNLQIKMEKPQNENLSSIPRRLKLWKNLKNRKKCGRESWDNFHF